MDLPASYYGEIDKRNPVIAGFNRDVNSFMTLMRQVTASNQDNSSYANGIQTLVEIWKKYKHRLPVKLYQEHMLQIADFLFGLKFYQVALWQGYSLHLLQYTSVKITDITDVGHFMACFFPEGFDTDQDVFAMKMRAMQGYALCVFEEVKKHLVLSQEGLLKLLQVLNFLRIMMQASQQHEHLHRQIYDGSLHIYSICRYLMSKKCSGQALEYLLWASISVELSIPLMTAKYLPLIVTLYCAVCHCYYDNHAEVQAEEFARRALGKINDLAKMDEQSKVPATRETQRAYKEASIKLGALIFKRAVFVGRKRPKVMNKIRMKSSLKVITNGLGPRTPTEHMLTDLFDGSAGRFLGVTEALWNSTVRPLQMRMPDDPELKEVIIELLSAGISILSGATSTSAQRCDNPTCLSSIVRTPDTTLIDQAITGENKVPIMSAVRFIKLLFHYKQLEAYTELAREMLQVLPDVEGPLFRKAERELALLNSYNTFLSSQRSPPTDIHADKHKTAISLSDEFAALVDTLHKSVCGFAPEERAEEDLVLDIVVFLWGKVKMLTQMNQLHSPEFTNRLQTSDSYEKWVLCLSLLCEVAFTCDQAAVDYVMRAEMIFTLRILLQSAPEHFQQTYPSGSDLRQGNDKSAAIELLQKVCEVAERGREALGSETLLPPPDGSAVTDSAFMQKCCLLSSSTSAYSLPSSDGKNEEDKIDETKDKTMDAKIESDFKGSPYPHASCMFLLAKDLHLELDIIFHTASLLLWQHDAVAECELLDRVKNNKVSKALFFIQKALLVYNKDPRESRKTTNLLQEATTFIEKAGIEERKVFMSTCNPSTENKDKWVKEEAETPPPPPILRSRTHHSFTFLPAPYKLEEQVCWYQLCGRAAEGVNKKVRLRDCSLPGTGYMVPAVAGECVLRAEGLEPNQKYVFAVAAYNSQGKLLGNTIGGTTLPVLAASPVPLLLTWAHLAQVAFQTGQYAIAKRACRELWSHFTYSDCGSHCPQDRFATTTGLQRQTLHCSSPHLCQLFLTSIFIETEINIQQGSLYCNSFSENGPFIWEQEARLAECERMLVAVDLAMCLNDGSAAVQAAVTCYSLLVPLIFHQIFCLPVVQVLRKCLIVLEDNSGLLKQSGTKNTSESFMHMIACITYYLSKALRVLREHQTAAVVMDCGRRLLQDVYVAQCGTVDHGVAKGQTKTSLQLRALQEKKRTTSETLLTTENEVSRPLTDCEDPSILYELISSSSLKDAYLDVMKLKREGCFTEFAALLLQRVMEEGGPNLVLNWGQTIFHIISRRDEIMGLSIKHVEGNGQTKRKGSAHASKGNDTPQNRNSPSHDDIRKRLKQKMPRSVFQTVRTNREMHLLENLLNTMSYVVQRNKKRLKLRSRCCEERVWRSHLNFSMAQAHLAVLYQGLDKLPEGVLQHRYSHFNPSYFSLAYSGVLVWKNSQQQQVVLEPHSLHSSEMAVQKHKNKQEGEKAIRPDDSVTEESCEDEGGFSKSVEQQVETQEHAAALLLDSLNKMALHLRRAMVLAHRGSHWTTLQLVCQTVWDQNSAITVLVQKTAQLQTPSPITADQLSTIFTPLLVLATDLIMDMLNKLGLWSLYDSDLTEEELESSLHFLAPLDDNIQVDLRWIHTLVLYTLELLHHSGKWESLAHFALLFNSYTRERYAQVVIPLLVDAQRKLLERISSCGVPGVPQPHHIKTLKVTGNEVTCRSYAKCQVLSGWRPHSAQKQINQKKVVLTKLTDQEKAKLKDAEIQLSMSYICVPLDVEDALRCYHEALEKKTHCLQVFQHGRSLLVLLLAHTQPCFGTQSHRCQSSGLSRSASQVDFSPVVKTTPNTQPWDLTEEDFSTPNAIYSLSISPAHIPTVTAAYSTSIKYLQANNHDSLCVLALHEMGNLHFYNGNMRAAHSSWSKAVDCALQSSNVVEKWDGMSFGSGSSQQTLKQAGVWGCLQAAVLTAKIAQYILTFDIGQRTRCCHLSVHLFKCVLSCSMAQPQTDLQYASHSIADELLPGTDLFSEPHRAHVGTTVTSLNFICHWLYSTGHYITVLPMLALHQHFVGNVCRDVQRAVDGRILKIRVLTQLCLFTEAVKEAFQLTQGTGVLLPFGRFIAPADLQPLKMFYSNKSLLDNMEALEELVNCDFAPEVRTLYGPTLCVRFNLARAQLVLALADSVCGSPVPASAEGEHCASEQDCPVTSKQQEQDTQDIESSCQKMDEPKGLTLWTGKERRTPESMKYLLLEGVSSLLDSISQQLTSQFCSEMENLELRIEFNLLKANLCLQQGHPALSSEMAVSSLELLQTSPLILGKSTPGLNKHADELSNTKEDTKVCSVSKNLEMDCPGAVEASERVGASLWLRCRLALVRSLTAHNPASAAVSPDKNHNEEAAQLLQEGIDECVQWGDHDTQALLMVEGAELGARRGRTDENTAMLQEAVNLLSGRTHIPPGSILTLARATLLLSDLRGAQSTMLLQLTQNLLKNQLSAFGESETLVGGKMCISISGPSNIYLPYLHMLNQTTLQIGLYPAKGAQEEPVSMQSSPSNLRQHSHQSIQPERASRASTSVGNANPSPPE